MIVDSHCHLNLLDLTSVDGNLETIVLRARTNDVSHLLNVCVSIKHFPQLLKTAQAYPDVSASLGLHPNAREEEVDEETLFNLGQAKKVVAIGETGLDYFRSEGDTQWQRDRFRAHIRAAKKLNKPIIVHTRAAKEDTLAILSEEKANEVAGVMHCFTEDWETAKAALEMNFYISFSGIVTFKNAKDIQEVAKKVPIDRVLIETDSPYLAPDPQRGRPNEPAFLKYTANFLSTLRDISYEEFAHETSKNFYRLFKGADAHNA